MEKSLRITQIERSKPNHDETLDLELIDFSDLERIEEAIAPVFTMVKPVGGSCSGGAGSGCACTT